VTDSWLNRVPFENDPLRRWLTLPIALIGYGPAVLVFHHMVGRPAFGLVAFVMAAGVGAVAGIRVGIVTAFCMQAVNFALAWIVEDNSSDPVLLAAAAFGESAILVLATGGLRALWQRIARTNRLLDKHIRARRAVEASLDESLSLHRNLVSTLGEGVGLFDLEDNFVFANPAADKLFGVSEGRLVGRSLEDFLTPESAHELRGWRDPLRKEPVSYELRLADPESRVLLVTDTRMAASGTAGEGQTLRVMRDVSERARLERERCELDRYLQHTEALRSLAVMAGGVAHDFNNLLGGVIGNTELGLMKLSESPSFARSCLEEARGFALEASELSRSMLAYAGKRNAAPKPLKLAQEVDAALRLVNALISKKATLANRIPASLPLLTADRTGLHQVVTNLVLNATEAMGDSLRGTLSLDAGVEEVVEGRFGSIPSTSAPKAGRYVVLSVSDTGAGMSKDVLSRLFEPFFSTKFSGRGIGLAATLGIVRAHGGGITVESEPGVGTTFRVYWPVAERSIGSEETLGSGLSLGTLRVER
jgi:PAS domain S-box-containing protein